MRSSSSVFDSGEWRFFQPRAAGFGGSPLFSVGCDTTGGEKKEVKLRKAIAGRGDVVWCVFRRYEVSGCVSGDELKRCRSGGEERSGGWVALSLRLGFLQHVAFMLHEVSGRVCRVDGESQRMDGHDLRLQQKKKMWLKFSIFFIDKEYLDSLRRGV
ncbi:hypothetical protein F2Q68_00037992 [Brassica cretica]|uniref:Uncharacterized protein n=1 Tax=Brassica cretica TaxID=69181 RepID=A0A8S9HA49_BRACR|nr:hypothetical protein F2Q68_00037992 [Brassica cretica]